MKKSHSKSHAKQKVSFRKGGIEDTKVILRFLKELATFEDHPDGCEMTVAQLRRATSDAANLNILMGEVGNDPVGVAMWAERFSAYGNGNRMWLLELYVAEPYRNQGIGRLFFSELERIAKRKKYKRMDWFITTTNKTAKAFYRKMGAAKTVNTERWKIELNDK